MAPIFGRVRQRCLHVVPFQTPFLPRRVAGAASASQAVTPERVAKLKTTFARASIAAKLLQSRLALPIAYPFNSAMLREGDRRAVSPNGWKEEEIQKGLAHITPLVVAMAKVAPLLKASQALSYYEGGHRRRVVPDADEEEDDIRIDFIRPQRLAGSGRGRGPGYLASKTGKGFGWDDVCSGQVIDSHMRRFTVDPYDDTPRLYTIEGRKYESRTKWNKRKSGSQ